MQTQLEHTPCTMAHVHQTALPALRLHFYFYNGGLHTHTHPHTLSEYTNTYSGTLKGGGGKTRREGVEAKSKAVVRVREEMVLSGKRTKRREEKEWSGKGM